MTATTTSVKNNKSTTLKGYLGGNGANIAWSATVTTSIAVVGGAPYSGNYSVYSGSVYDVASKGGATNWYNAALIAAGAPYGATTVALSAGMLNTTAVETIAYTFSNAVPAGSSFMLLDPGATYPSYTGVETYAISATYKGAAVSTSGWTYTILSPDGSPVKSTITVSANGGLITVNAYSGKTWPDTVVLITPNVPITSLSVTANTIPYDFWGIALPHIPSALLFVSANVAPSSSNTLAQWQINAGAVTGTGVIGNPGLSWAYVGSGDFRGDGGTDLLMRNANGSLVYLALSGSSIYATGTLPTPDSGWAVVGVGDYNGDGKSDLLFEDGAGNINVWLMSGATTLSGSGLMGALGTNYTYVGSGNFNGSGYSAVLVENIVTGEYWGWFVSGAYIGFKTDFGAPPAGSVFLGIGDFNGDGTADVMFENPLTGVLTLWLMSSGSNVWKAVTLNSVPVYEKAVAVGTFTPSDCADIIFQNTLTGGLDDFLYVNWALTAVDYIGNPGFYQTVALAPWQLPPPPTPTLIFTDAAGDIQTWSAPYGVHSATGNFASSGPNWTLLAAGNFDGTLNPDFLLENTSGNYVLLLTDGSKFTYGGYIGTPGPAWQFKGLGDFNGDGIQDILFVNSTTGEYVTWLLNSNIVIGGRSLGVPPPGFTLAGIADLNGAGTSDLVVSDGAGNYYSWLIASGNFVGAQYIGYLGTDWSLAATDDFNGDGRTDLLFENAAGNFTLWDMNASSIIGGGTFNGPGAGWSFFGASELSGNREASLLFENNATGAVMAYNMNDTTLASITAIDTLGAGWTPKSAI